MSTGNNSGISRPKGLPARYQIIDLLGRGRFATVFKVLDEEQGSFAALKVLHPEHLASIEHTGRFEREMTVCRNLSHPNIIKVKASMLSKEIAFIVMDYLEANNLSDLLRERSFSTFETLTIITQVAAALDYIHDNDLVHRDVKPENIMVSSSLQTVLTDFNLVRLPYRTSFSGVGSVLGTPLYVSPEIVKGVEASPSSDIYAMGLVFWELLTDHKPFDGVRGMGPLLKAIVGTPLPPPSSIKPSLPTAFDEIVARATHKEPEARYASAEEFIKAVEKSGLEGKKAVLSLGSAFSKIPRQRPLSLQLPSAAIITGIAILTLLAILIFG